MCRGHNKIKLRIKVMVTIIIMVRDMFGVIIGARVQLVLQFN